MKISRSDITKRLHDFEHYIKKCCPSVRDVYGDSIYFQNDDADYGASWYLSLGGCKDPHLAIKQINGTCDTNFYLED